MSQYLPGKGSLGDEGMTIPVAGDLQETRKTIMENADDSNEGTQG